MRHVRMLGLCLVAAMAVAALGASSAFAGAEFGKCEAKPGGNYKDANCTEKAKPKGSGSYEWRKGSELPPVKFTGASEGETQFETTGGVLFASYDVCSGAKHEYSNGYIEYESIEWGRMTRAACAEKTLPWGLPGNKGERRLGAGTGVLCSAETSTGETVGKNSVEHVHVTFTGCAALGVYPCSNAGPEEIKTEELKGKLGYISKSGHEAGIVLEPAHGKVFASFRCPEITAFIGVGVGNNKEGAEFTSSGCIGPCVGTTPEEEKHGGYHGIISPIRPVNKMTSSFTQEYKVETDEGHYLNASKAFEGKHIDELESYLENEERKESTMWSSAGEEITNTNTLQPTGEEGEIKA